MFCVSGAGAAAQARFRLQDFAIQERGNRHFWRSLRKPPRHNLSALSARGENMLAAKVWTAFVAAVIAVPAYAENGVSANKILIGQSASMTGTSAESGQQMREGALAYFE